MSHQPIDLPVTDLWGDADVPQWATVDQPRPEALTRATPKPIKWQNLKAGTSGDCGDCVREIHQQHITRKTPWHMLPRPELAVLGYGPDRYCHVHALRAGYGS